ncbi:hypothetical protein EDB19DRAFT_1694820 [Suillus lakei]|nr:hypothetical protein EDB19DRAFT_1694820 [Suillus lakei]
MFPATQFVLLFQLCRILLQTAIPNNQVLFRALTYEWVCMMVAPRHHADEMKHTHTAFSSSFSSFEVFCFTLEIMSGVHAP